MEGNINSSAELNDGKMSVKGSNSPAVEDAIANEVKWRRVSKMTDTEKYKTRGSDKAPKVKAALAKMGFKE